MDDAKGGVTHMPRFSTENTDALKKEINAYFADFIGETISPIRIWYEAFGGYGVPRDVDLERIANVIEETGDWTDIGVVRDEKFGGQPTYKRNVQLKFDATGDFPVQHMFKLNSMYKTPDGRLLKVVVSEVYNLRCFEIVDGHMTGSMIKIDPKSDLAAGLVEVI